MNAPAPPTSTEGQGKVMSEHAIIMGATIGVVMAAVIGLMIGAAFYVVRIKKRNERRRGKTCWTASYTRT